MARQAGRDGQVGVPEPAREHGGTKPGDDVQSVGLGGEVRIGRAVRLEELRGSLGPAIGMADWEAEKRRERAREEREPRSDPERRPQT